MSILDWETPPTAEGIIIHALSDEIDSIRVKPTDIGDDIGNLNMIEGAFIVMGMPGTLSAHGFTDIQELVGKKCLLYSNNRFESVAIEPEYAPVVWVRYV